MLDIFKDVINSSTCPLNEDAKINKPE